MRVSLGGRLTNPAAELAKYENEHPSVDLIEDFKNVIEDHGLKYEEIRATAEAYDYLRIARCRSAAISEQDGNDRKQRIWFEKKFKSMLQQIKDQKF